MDKIGEQSLKEKTYRHRGDETRLLPIPIAPGKYVGYQ